MSKSDKKSKGKSSKKGAPELSKKERKKLEAREAELLEKLAKKKSKKPRKPEAPVLSKKERKARAKIGGQVLPVAAVAEPVEAHAAPETHEPESAEAVKAAKKEQKKSGKLVAIQPGDTVVTPNLGPKPAADSFESMVDLAERGIIAPMAVAQAVDGYLATGKLSDEEAKLARALRSEALSSMSDEDLKTRVEQKSAARKALADSAQFVPRNDADAVARYNAALAELGGGTYLTTTDELAERQASVAEDAPMPGGAQLVELDEPARGDKYAGYDGTPEKKSKVGKKVKAGSKGPEPEEATTPAQVVESVETERGTAYVVGTVDVSGEQTTGTTAGVADAREEIDANDANLFAKPSEAPHLDGPALEEGRNGYKIHPLKADGTPDLKKELQYTRVTTFIGNLEDRTNLEKWSKRKLLEGVVVAETDPEIENTVPTLADLIHRRDVALAKARKADKKGKLAIGERAVLEGAAEKEFKDAVNAIVEELSELGGIHEKANKGTNLHALAETYDAEGMDPIDSLLEDGEISATDHASIVAYGEALKTAGIKIIEAEVVVVDDGVTILPPEDAPKGTRAKHIGRSAGRLDRTCLVKTPGSSRAARVVADIKSGSLDFGQGKLAQQLAKYANSKGYDLETGERRDLKLSKAWGLVIHLPQGEGTCHIYWVDLATGNRGNKLSAEVRAWRSDSSAAVDFSVDLAHPVAVTA